MIIYCLILLIIAVALLSYAFGYRAGKKIISLSGLGASEAFAYFISHEILRHEKDIARSKRDLAELRRRGIVPPKIPLGLWIEVKKGG